MKQNQEYCLRGKYWVETSLKNSLIQNGLTYYKLRRFLRNNITASRVKINERLILKSETGDSIMLWKKGKLSNGISGIKCVFLKNKSKTSTSELLIDAISLAKLVWVESIFFIQIDQKYFPADIEESLNLNGWKFNGINKGGKREFVLQKK